MTEITEGLPPSDGTPMVVSSNRYLDIKPYVDRLYTQGPDKHGSIFPEDLPKDPSSIAKEQKWLRDWFGDREIHVQGGDPEGFRFLKQVLTCCALWNAFQKVPAMVDYWFAQEANRELLDDPLMCEHMCKAETQPSAFFPGGELGECGERSLRKATDAIQERIRKSKGLPAPAQKPQAEVKEPIQGQTVESTASGNDSVQPSLRIDTPPMSAALDMEHGMKTSPHSTQPTPIVKARLPATSDLPGVPEQPPQPPATVDPSTQGERLVPYPQQARRGRGGSNAGRGGGRSYQKSQYQQAPYYDHNAQSQYSPSFDAWPSNGRLGPQQMQNHLRSSSGGPVPITQPSPRVSVAQTAQCNMNMPQQYSGPGMQVLNHQQAHHQQMLGSQPIYIPHSQMQQPYLSSAIVPTERSNQQYCPSNIGADSETFVSNEPYSHRGNSNRKDSNASRGGRARGFSSGSLRGKGSRGSYAADSYDICGTSARYEPRQMSGDYRPGFEDYPPRSGDYRQTAGDVRQMVGNSHRVSGDYRPVFGDPSYPNFAGNDRRSSMTTKWRSRNEQTLPKQDENTAPNRMFSGPPTYSDKNTYPRSPPGLSRYANDSQNMTARPMAPNPGFMPINDPSDEAARKNPELVATRFYIGSKCTHISKLVLFDVTLAVTEGVIYEYFKRVSNIVIVRKSYPRFGMPNEMYWLHFTDNIEAQKALTIGVQQWQGPEIRVEVPRQYWESDHHWYPGFDQGSKLLADAQDSIQSKSANDVTLVDRTKVHPTEEGAMSGDVTPAASGHIAGMSDEQRLSLETTPVASGDNAPKDILERAKSKRNKKEKTKENNKQTADLSDPPLHAAPAASHTSESKLEDMDVYPTAKLEQTPDESPYSAPTEKLSESSTEPGDSLFVDSRKSSAVSVDAQTKSELGLSPALEVKAQLPPLVRTDGIESGANTTVIALPSTETSGPSKETISVADRESHTETLNQVEDSRKGEMPLEGPISRQADGDLADDSFHTTISTPGSQGEGKHVTINSSASGERLNTTFTPKTTVEVRTSPVPIENTTRNDSMVEAILQHEKSDHVSITVSAKVTKKAPVPKQPLSVKIAEPGTKRGEDASRKASDSQHSASSRSVPPTPAFHTAPSTPAVLLDASVEKCSTPTEALSQQMQQSTEGSGSSPSELINAKADEMTITEKEVKNEKVDKAKGPSRTESLNPFAKPPQKKKQKSKKGTVKGKSKVDALTDQGASRTASGTMTSNSLDDEVTASPRVGNDRTENRPSGDIDKTNTASVIPDAANKDKDIETVADPVATGLGRLSPSKSVSTLGNLVRGFFGSSQTSSSVANGAVADDRSLKAALIETKNEKRSADNSEPVSQESSTDYGGSTVAAGPASSIPATAADHRDQSPFRSFPEGPDMGALRDSGDSGGDNPSGGAEVGLGISTADDVTEEAPKAKKKRPKKKKKTNMVDDAVVQAMGKEDDTAKRSPETANEPPRTAFTFEFTARNVPINPDKISDASSSTIAGDETPTSPATSSAQDPSPSRKLILTQMQKQNSGNLVQAKPFSRKIKRRISPKSTTATANNEEDGSETELTESNEGTPGKSEASPEQRSYWLYIYTGPGQTTEVEEESQDESLTNLDNNIDGDLPRLIDNIVQQRSAENGDAVNPSESSSADAFEE